LKKWATLYESVELIIDHPYSCTGSSRTIHTSSSSSSKISRHPSGSGFEIYGDTSTPGILSKATGQIRNIPLDPSINQENIKHMETLKGAKVQITSLNQYNNRL